MATQTDESSLELSPEVVGHAFVDQFYRILHESPELVHRFYQDSSTMSRPGRDGTLTTVTAMKGIQDLILSLDCKDYKAEILTADGQASHMCGVIVLVTGCLTGKDNVRRKFTESFFLAPQEKGYFVLNDVFRFVEEDCLLVVNSVEEKGFDKTTPVATLVPVNETVEVQENSVQNHTVAREVTIENKIEPTEESRNEQKPIVTEKAVPQASVDSSQVVQPVIETLSNGHVDAPKKSYASLLKNMKAGAITTQVRVPTKVAKSATPKTTQQSVVPPAVQQATATAVPATPSEPSAPNGSNSSTSSTEQTEDKGHSIYVGDLPWNATIELVEQEFKKFGNIKRNGIQVRSNKGYCFGFVEYEDASGKQNAIKMGTMQISGKEAFIQEKKTSTRVVNGVSMYPSGRGGFRNDGFRGRGNYSNGFGYARNDYGKRDGETRNGDGYQNRNGETRNGDGYKNRNGETRNGDGYKNRNGETRNGDGYKNRNGDTRNGDGYKNRNGETRNEDGYQQVRRGARQVAAPK